MSFLLPRDGRLISYSSGSWLVCDRGGEEGLRTSCKCFGLATETSPDFAGFFRTSQ